MKFFLQFVVPWIPIKHIPALVQIIAWRQSGNKPSSEPIMVKLSDSIYVSVNINDFKGTLRVQISIF